MRTFLSIAAFSIRKDLASKLDQCLHDAHVQIEHFNDLPAFLHFVVIEHSRLDCLIIEDCDLSIDLSELRSQPILLPLLIIRQDSIKITESDPSPSVPVEAALYALNNRYREAEIAITISQIDQLEEWINEAINRFIALSLDAHLTLLGLPRGDKKSEEAAAIALISAQQQRLTEKLKERLGYLGVYYKRNPENFLRYLSSAKQKEFLDQLKLEYRQIILNYFGNSNALNQKIDHFVHAAFFADIPVSKVVELHIGLMDEFAKQLKLEGRSEEILLDYRLTLIDVIAHLCEMYRRSIPRES